MIRSAVVVVCVFSVATLLSEALGLAFLWSRGQLTPETLDSIRAVLSGDELERAGSAGAQDKVPPSSNEIIRERSLSILELETRRQELAVLKDMLDEKADALLAEKKKLEERRQKFEEHLQALDEQTEQKGIERARGILNELRAEGAAQNLMELSVDESIAVLKGMPEEDIARILETMQKDQGVQATRAREIFKALTKGEPERSLIKEAEKELDTQANAEQPEPETR